MGKGLRAELRAVCSVAARTCPLLRCMFSCSSCAPASDCGKHGLIERGEGQKRRSEEAGMSIPRARGGEGVGCGGGAPQQEQAAGWYLGVSW